GLKRQNVLAFVPTDADPEGLALQVVKRRTVVIIENKPAVGSGIHLESRWFVDGLAGVLPNRVQREDGAGARINRKSPQIHRALQPSSPGDLLLGPPVVPIARGQIKAPALGALFDDGRD